jgi:N-acylneuraminate cytidylyltransferase
VNLAVIPARGGSKRIPRKNIRPFGGRPMIAWSIEAASASGLFDRVIVSTDDEEIADCARSHGAEVPFTRPPELSDDHAGTLEVVRHAVERTVEEGARPEAVCCLYATAPFVTAEDLAAARAMLMDGDFNYVFAAARFPCPVQRGFTRSPAGTMELLFPEHRLTRSQDLPPVYHDAGQFYWGRTEAWLEGRAIFGERSGFVELPSWRVQDIDTPEDWTKAEQMLEILKRADDGQ